MSSSVAFPIKTHQRKIIHIDMDAFFASVEQRDTPALQGRPVIVGGQPDSRGVVAACSYEARQFGIHSAMPSSRAKRLCPDAIFVPPRFQVYREISQQLHDIFSTFTDFIEPLSLDEAYLDVSESQREQGSATLIARAITQEISHKLNLSASAGVSYNKFLAKIASDMDKPNGLYVIRPEQAEAFILKLPVRKFFGVGKVTEKKMQQLGIHTGADLRNWPEPALRQYFGKSGGYYYRIARGIDDRPVRNHRQRKSIGKEITFSADLLDTGEILMHLQQLGVRVAELLQQKELTAKTFTLKVKYHDFIQITRSISFSQELSQPTDFLPTIPILFAKTELGKRPCRLLGLSASNLSKASDASAGQLSLF
ncbi:MAG: DNA polymerase IV [Pseudomonadales bacterium]|nr:DNA polymerase IV [Pseudomonadales bacterium]